jgi:phospholipid/cholesterol/gamma-HCH transport system permease protein
VLLVVTRMGRMGMFLFDTILYTVVPPIKTERVLKQMLYIGFQSVPLIALTGATTGMVLAFQLYYALAGAGTTALLGPSVAMTLLRELGPLFAALMVVARVGSSVTAELGVMRINEEIDALELMGLNPFRYLIVPTMIAALICVPLLTAMFDVVGIFGGYLIGVKMLGVGTGTYFGNMTDYVKLTDVTGGAYKSLCFGGIIAWVSTYKGFYSGFGPEGVGRATTQSVVLSSVLIIVSDYLLTSLMW